MRYCLTFCYAIYFIFTRAEIYSNYFQRERVPGGVCSPPTRSIVFRCFRDNMLYEKRAPYYNDGGLGAKDWGSESSVMMTRQANNPHKHGLHPARMFLLGFGGMILAGALLLALPIATKSGTPLPFVDALFTSTSAICVTGLSVFEVGSTLSLFGQITLLTLIQVGGIGFMAVTSMLYMLIGKRFTLRDRMALQDSMSSMRLQGVVRMTRDVLILTAIIEAAAFLLFAMRFIPLFGLPQGLYLSMYQAISSFCNAGFDVFGLGTSMAPFANDPLVMLTTMATITLGGLGFYVILDLYHWFGGKRKRKRYRLSLHTKLVLSISGILTGAGFILFLIFEFNNPTTFGTPEGVYDIPPGEKLLGAMFQSVTARTAGFSSVPQANLVPASKSLTVLLMFIGASPGGTGGGIKTTTAILVILFLVSIVRGREDVEVFGRRIDRHTVHRALAVFTLGLLFVLVSSILVSVLEHGNIKLSDIIFEIVSAFGTVGVASGNTAAFSDVSKCILMITMYGGRLGIFTFTMALAAKMSASKPNIRYPKDNVMIG